MLGIHIQTKDAATEVITDLEKDIEPDRVAPIIGRAGVNHIKGHLVSLDNSRANRLGGKRTHFYASAARSTNFQITSEGVVISINHVGVAQRYFGGTIRPVNAKRLTIPASAEAYGKRAGEFGKLEPVFGRNGIVGLRRPKHKTAGRTRQGRYTRGGEILFWLVKSATQAADKSVLPTEAELGAEVREQVGTYIERQKNRKR